jgi:hypothetical protein
MFLLLVLSAMLSPQAQPTATVDAELWTAAVELVRRHLQVGRGELVISNQTIPTSEFHTVRDSSREAEMMDLLRKRNDSTRKSISGVRLSPGVRLVDASSVHDWADFFAKQFPGSKLVMFSLPAFSEDGRRAIVYYSASGGFDDSQGAYLVFENRQRKWGAVYAFGMWIT